MKYLFPVTMAIIVILFFGRIAYNGYEHGKYSDMYSKECHGKGGVRVTISSGSGWAKYACLKSEDVIKMGLLESSLVKHPS
jgi:hypothetical protein